VEALDALACGLAVLDLGGGRLRKDDRVDHGAGLAIAAPVGSRVRRGEPLVHVHAASEEVARGALPRLEAAWRVGPRPVEPGPHLVYRVDRAGVRPWAA
jgi:thymidine phosphorylase